VIFLGKLNDRNCEYVSVPANKSHAITRLLRNKSKQISKSPYAGRKDVVGSI